MTVLTVIVIAMCLIALSFPYIRKVYQIRRILPYYKKAYTEISEDVNVNKTYLILKDENMQWGICYFYNKKYKKHLSERWIARNQKGRIYWFNTPTASSTKHDLLYSISRRIEIMEKELKTFRI